MADDDDPDVRAARRCARRLCSTGTPRRWSRDAAVDAHLAACPSCRALVADVRAIRPAARTLEPMAPPARVWAAVRARVSGERAARAARRRRSIAWRRGPASGRPVPAGGGRRGAGADGVGARLGRDRGWARHLRRPWDGAGSGSAQPSSRWRRPSTPTRSRRLEEAAADAPRGLDAADERHAARRASTTSTRHRRSPRGAGARARRRSGRRKACSTRWAARWPCCRTRWRCSATTGGTEEQQPMTIARAAAALTIVALDRRHRRRRRARSSRPTRQPRARGPGQGRQRSRPPRRDPPAARGAAPAAGGTAAGAARRRAAGRWRRSSSPGSAKIGRQGTLNLVNASGSVTITSGGGDDVRIEATKRVWDSTDAAAKAALSDVRDRGDGTAGWRGRPHRVPAPATGSTPRWTSRSRCRREPACRCAAARATSR